MKKKLIFLLSVLIIITIALTGCNWLSWGLINVFDPEAQLRVSCSDITGDTISLEVYSLNKVGFNGEGFSYKYYSNGILIPHLLKTVGEPFYVEPSDSSGAPGPITKIDLLLYSQEVQDYITSNPLAEMTCTISLIGTDEAGHDILKSITVSLPALPETEPEPSPSGKVVATLDNWDQEYYQYLEEWSMVNAYYTIENNSDETVYDYKIYFTVNCSDGSVYYDSWYEDYTLSNGQGHSDYALIETFGKQADSVKINELAINIYY